MNLKQYHFRISYLLHEMQFVRQERNVSEFFIDLNIL